MRPTKLIFITLVAAVIFIVRCKKDDESPLECEPTSVRSRFQFSEFPLPSLSDYGFFIGDIKDQEPSNGFLPYDVITPLFADYAHKKRFLWMPEGVSADYNGDHEILEFPEGTIIVKTFYYDNVLPSNEARIMETRLMYKYLEEWHFADYVWNEEQSEALFDLSGSNHYISFLNDESQTIDVNYRVPAEAECFTCHKITDDPLPIGPKPQNINKDYNYSDGEMNQLEKWIEIGYLTSETPSQIETVADWTDESLPKLDRVRAYLDMNCAHCHREGSHCSYRPMRFAWNETDIMENIGVCVEPQEPIDPFQLHVVSPGTSSKSMLYYRINNTDPAERMPLMGRTLIHEEGVTLIKEWINELDIICE